MKVKKILLLAMAAIAPTAGCWAEETVLDSLSRLQRDTERQLTMQSSAVADKTDRFLLNHLDAALTVGTPGIGLDLAMPIGKYVQVRAGFAWMPPLQHHMTFNLTTEQAANSTNTNNVITGNRFEKMADMMEGLSGQRIDQDVQMIGSPTFYNFKLLFDVYPFKGKKWFATAGFYVGNRRIAKAYNEDDEISTLFSVNMFNSIQQRVADAYNDPVNDQNLVYLFNYNGMDVQLPPELAAKMYNFGRVGFRLGDCFVTPDNDNMVRATATANRFKPYIGVGWGDSAFRSDKKWAFSVSLGCLFWGGAPKVYADEEYYPEEDYVSHYASYYAKLNPDNPTDYIEMAQLFSEEWPLTVPTVAKREVNLSEKNVKGHVGDYIDLIGKFKVYPVLNIRIARRIF